MFDHPYEELVKGCPAPKFSTAETKKSYQVITERHLQAIWLEQKYFDSLTTLSGIPIQVLSPGLWNSEAGPDFLKAHLIVGNKEYRGDVELHLSDDGWHQHQHNHDKRYDQVVLHISFLEPKNERPIVTSEGREVIRTYLKKCLQISEPNLLKIIDLDLYPYHHFVGSGRCAETLFNKITTSKTTEFFRSAAIWRLKQKKQFLLSKLSDSNEYMKAGIAMALGFKKNSESFLELFLQTKNKRFINEHHLLAFLLGTCGFFDNAYPAKWNHSEYYQSLKEIFLSYPLSERLNNFTLKLDTTRPPNNPIRRLAALSKVMMDSTINSIPTLFTSFWKENWEKNKHQLSKNMKKKLLEFLPNYHDHYWEHHYSFENKAHKTPLKIISEQLKNEFLINICLPFLYDEIEKQKNLDEKQAFETFYGTLSGTKTKKSSYLSQRFFGDNGKKDFQKKADLQQGAYQVHRDFCIHYEASCIGCPFVERFITINNNALNIL